VHNVTILVEVLALLGCYSNRTVASVVALEELEGVAACDYAGSLIV